MPSACAFRLAQWLEWLRMARQRPPGRARLRLAADASASARFSTCSALPAASPGGCCFSALAAGFLQRSRTAGLHLFRFIQSCSRMATGCGNSCTLWVTAPLGHSHAALMPWAVDLSARLPRSLAQVQLHARSVRRFLDEFNKIAIHEALVAGLPCAAGRGLRPMWVVGAL